MMAACKSAWTPVSAPLVCHLTEIMSEQLIEQLTVNETLQNDDGKLFSDNKKNLNIEEPNSDEVDDLLLAQILQHEFDLEYDDLISLQEKNINKSSKVKISLANFRSLDPWVRKQEQDYAKSHFLNEDYLNESSLSDNDSIEENDSLSDESDHETQESLATPKLKLQELKKVKVTKHDSEVCGKKNMGKFMSAPPGIDTGDCDGHGIKFGNPVYNALKRHCIRVDKRRQRLHENKEKSTAEQAMDTKTRLIIYKMINKDLLKSVHGCISAGKEACVFHATGGSGTMDETQQAREVPRECALKVYKTILTNFKNRELYVRNDYQFGSLLKPHSRSSKLIKLWAEKEVRNLMRMARGGIKVPSVVTLQKNVLVMEFIGRDGIPAPKLKDAPLSYSQWEMAYAQIVEAMVTLFQRCRLVHADLSEYNILWHDEMCYFIDVGQSVEPIHPLALEFLYRDCHNVINFFAKKNLVGLHSAEQLFNRVTGLNLKGDGGQEFLSQIEVYTKSDEYQALAHLKQEADEARFDHLMQKMLLSKEANEVEIPESLETSNHDTKDDQGEFKIVKQKNKRAVKLVCPVEPSLECQETINEMVPVGENDDSDSDDSSFVKIELE